jgi:L-cystine uptake protein TcyP (sodium:dicarboxylate symporter family)
MLAIEITINVAVLTAIIIFSFGLGIFVRKIQAEKKQRRIVELEQEMLKAHAQILELSKNIAQLTGLKNEKNVAPVVKLKDLATDDTMPNNMSKRKKQS